MKGPIVTVFTPATNGQHETVIFPKKTRHVFRGADGGCGHRDVNRPIHWRHTFEWAMAKGGRS